MEQRPYPSEHSCRVNDPGKYDSFRRQNGAITSGGKKIDVIYGIKDGKSEIQAYRYPKAAWTASAARSHCSSHDGSFEAAKESNAMRETRVVETRIELDGNKIGGYIAKFNAWSLPLGFFREQVLPGAFSKTISEGDQRCCFNHKPELILGRRSAGTFALVEDDVGLMFECNLPDTTTGRDVRESIERGDITGCSFTFDTIKDRWNEDGNERSLVEVRMYEGGPVTFPAYPATEVSVRAMLMSRNLQIVDFINWMHENRDSVSDEDIIRFQNLIAEIQADRCGPEDDEPPQAGHSDEIQGLRCINILRRQLKLKEYGNG